MVTLLFLSFILLFLKIMAEDIYSVSIGPFVSCIVSNSAGGPWDFDRPRSSCLRAVALDGPLDPCVLYA